MQKPKNLCLVWHCLPLIVVICGGCGPQTANDTSSVSPSPSTIDELTQPQQPASDQVAPQAEPPTNAALPKRISDDDFRFAAYEGKIETVRRAIAAGCNVNAAEETKSLTALHMAAYNGHTEVVRLLIDNQATIDCRDSEGKTPLLHACTGPFAETVSVLIAAGADVNAKESTEAFTPLMMAAGLGEKEVVEILLAHKADADLLDDDGDSALQHAKNSGHTEIVQLLSK